MRFFKGESPPFRGVAYRPDGRALITATQGGRITLWDLDSGRELTRLKGHPGPPYRSIGIDAIAISPDCRLLAAAGDALRVWNLDTGEPLVGFDSPTAHSLRGAVFALGGSRLVAGIYYRWRHEARQQGLMVWDTADGTTLSALPAPGVAHPLTASPDGQSVFGDCNARPVRWHIPARQEHATQFATPSPSSAMAVSVPTGVVAQGTYRVVEIRDANGERLLAQWEAHKKGVFALAFSADGNLLATGSGDEVVKVWDVSGVAGVLADPNAAPLTAVPERGAYEWGLGPVRAIAFSPDGLTAAAVGDRVKFVVWDVE